MDARTGLNCGNERRLADASRWRESDFDALHDWSVKNREAYWAAAIERLDIRWRQRWSCLLDLSKGLESPRWLTGAQLNIVESCLAASPGAPAIVHQSEGRPLRTMNIGELAGLSRKVAAGLRSRGFQAGDHIAMVMPMTPEAVAIYLGIIQTGGVVVAVPESFRAREIGMRLRLAKAAAVFTQDVVLRDRKQLELYRFFAEISAPMAVVLPAGDDLVLQLRPGDVAWKDFLTEKTEAPMQTCGPDDPISVLFSSGTTGEPKAIPWSHMTPIKCAADAHFHSGRASGGRIGVANQSWVDDGSVAGVCRFVESSGHWNFRWSPNPARIRRVRAGSASHHAGRRSQPC